MFSLRSSAVAAAFIPATLAQVYSGNPYNHTCLLVPDYQSCSVNANPLTVDSCCVETYGGLGVATQFWDTYTGLESKGQLLPKYSWTIHGLWPDFCNGSYTQYCDANRQYDPSPSPNTTTGPNGTLTTVKPYKGPGVDTFIKDFGRYDLLAYMNKYWVNQGASNADFWAHEFSKHATCYSTFDTECAGPKYVQHQEVIEFYETAIKFYRKSPTFDWLADAGIVPSNTTSYTLSDIQNALRVRHGGVPYLGCSGPRFNATTKGANSTDSGRTVLDEVWYYFNFLGRPQDGRAVALDAAASNSSITSCAKSAGAIWYYERTPSSEH